MLDKFFGEQQPKLPNIQEAAEKRKREEEAKLQREIEKQVRQEEFFEKVENFIDSENQKNATPDYVTEVLNVTPGGVTIDAAGFKYLIAVVGKEYTDAGNPNLKITYQGQEFITQIYPGYNKVYWKTGTFIKPDMNVNFSIVLIKQNHDPGYY